MATVDENTFFEQTFDFGITAKVVADDPGSYDSPRDNDTAGRLLLSHRRYTLGDDEKKLGFKFRFDDFGSWAEVEKFLRDEHDAFVVLPVSATDHGGLHVYVGSPRDQWDSGRLGLAYMTRKEATSGWQASAYGVGIGWGGQGYWARRPTASWGESPITSTLSTDAGTIGNALTRAGSSSAE